MRPDDQDMARLWDMLDAAQAILDFVHGMSFGDFLDDRRTRNAVERNLEIIGEAARGVSPELRVSQPDIPWTSIIGLRNIIAHEYGELLHDRIWEIGVRRLPSLVEHLRRLGADTSPDGTA